MRKKRLFISIDIQESLMVTSLRHPINKAGSTTSFNFENAFPSVSLSAKELKLFINDSGSKENKNKIDVTE